MPFFRKLPVTIEAMQFTEADKNKVFNWVGGNRYADFDASKPVLKIETLEGVMTVSIGDWVIRGVRGEFYPCKDEIFRATYTPAPGPGTESDE